MATNRDVFTRIYSDRVWTQGSGSGSHPDNTLAYRQFLQNFMKERTVTSVVDFGCGDWQSSQFIDWNGIAYLGVDVVESLIQENVRKYQRQNIRFVQSESLDSPLPLADLLIVKDVFQHWPNGQVQAFQHHFSRFRFALITNTRESNSIETGRPVGTALNGDIELSDLRSLDLSLPPFDWPVEEVFCHTSHRWSSNVRELKATVLYIKTT